MPLPHPIFLATLLVLLIFLVTADNSSFVDEFGFRCEGWDGYDCSTAAAEHGYTAAGQAALFENCPTTCGVISTSAPSPALITTTTTSPTPSSPTLSAPLPTASIAAAIAAGGAVSWASGTGTLARRLGISTAVALECTSVVAKCIVDAKASVGDEGRALVVAHGGATASDFTGLLITGGYISMNDGDTNGLGGGVYVENGSKANFIHCELSKNRAYGGGGFAVWTGTANLFSTVFSGNTASWAADVYGDDGDIRVYGCTFSPFLSDTNFYSVSATITFEGSGCDVGEEGVVSSYTPTVATGNWGSGFFSGTPTSYLPGLDDCRDCTAGRYANTPYAHECSPCQEGTFTNTDGATTCSNCAMGEYVTSTGATACTLCEAGRYSTTEGADTVAVCDKCEPGTYSTPASTACSTCASGRYSNSERSDCDDCEAGEYSESGAGSCLSCEKGSFSTPTSSACTTCAGGKFSNPYKTFCSDCEAGEFAEPGADKCLHCDSGAYSTAASSTCTTCTPGKYSTKTSCDDCEQGKFSTAAVDKCTACPIGKSAPSSSSSSCTCTSPFATLPDDTCACTAGFSFDGLTCERCDNGYFKSATSNNPCTTCNSALKGSLSTRSGDFPSSPSSCICGSGEVQVDIVCEPCPEGGVCDELGLTLEDMPLMPTYWRTSNSSADVLKCSNEAACTPPANSTDACALNHVGPFCEMCAEGFALAAGSCVSCKDGKAASITLAAMAAVLLGALGWCVYSIKDREEVEEAVGAAVGAGGIFVKRFKLPAKLLLQYYQIISMLEVALNLEFPPVMSGFANGASASNLDAFAIVPTGCAFAMDIHDKLLMFGITIVTIGAVVGAYSVVKKKSLFKTYLIGLSFILPTVTRLIFMTFPCVEVDTGERWLVADKSISCDDEGHKGMVVYAYFMFLIICVGLPGGCFAMLFVNRAKINPPDVSEDEALRLREADKSLDYIRFLFRSYRPAYWYWEVLEMNRRIFMTGFLVVLVRGSLEQIIICVVVTVVTLKAVGSRRPYLRLTDEDGTVDAVAPDNNDVAEVMAWQTIITLLLCVLVQGGREAEGGVLGEKALDGMLVASQFLFILLLFEKRVKKKLSTVLAEGLTSESATIARLEREKAEAATRESRLLEEIDHLKKKS